MADNPASQTDHILSNDEIQKVRQHLLDTVQPKSHLFDTVTTKVAGMIPVNKRVFNEQRKLKAELDLVQTSSLELKDTGLLLVGYANALAGLDVKQYAQKIVEISNTPIESDPVVQTTRETLGKLSAPVFLNLPKVEKKTR